MKRIIDKDGMFLRDDFTWTEDEIGLDVQPSQGLYIPKWNFELNQWEESATQEYIDSLKQPIVLEPSLEERMTNVEQEQEVIITVLSDIMGV